jgi:predicted MFS family arabinose efflux permease
MADSRRSALFFGCLLFVSGSGIFYMMPPYLNQLGIEYSLDLDQLGMLASLESVGIGIASALAPLWIGRIANEKSVFVGVVICVVGDWLTGHAGSYAEVLGLRLTVGLLGEGVLFAVSFSILGLLADVDRAFAIALTAAVSSGAVVIAAAGALQRLFPPVGTLVPLIAATLLVLLFARVCPVMRAAEERGKPAASANTIPVMLALLAQTLWFGAPGAFWTFAEQVALDKGFDSGTAELALSIGEFASLVGSLVAVVLGHRLGRLFPVIASSAGMVISAALYFKGSTVAELALLLSVFYGLWNYGAVYHMSFVTALDFSGRFSVMMPAAQVFGISLGCMTAGRLMALSGDGALVSATATFAVSGIMVLVLARQYSV